MSGLKGIQPCPNMSDARLRRLTQVLGANAESIVTAPLAISNHQISLSMGNGLVITSGSLLVSLATNSGLQFSSGGLQVKSGNGIIVAADVSVNLDTNPALAFTSAKLGVKVKANGGITKDADGLSVAAASASYKGGVLQGAAVTSASSNLDIVGQFNALLTSLRNAGTIST